MNIAGVHVSFSGSKETRDLLVTVSTAHGAKQVLNRDEAALLSEHLFDLVNGRLKDRDGQRG